MVRNVEPQEMENEFNDHFVKVQMKGSYELFWHDTRMPNKIINNAEFMYVKRNKNDAGFCWIDKKFIEIPDFFETKSKIKRY